MSETYDTLAAIAQTRRRKLGNNTYLEIEPDYNSSTDVYCVRLHATRIVYLYANGAITLNAGGWQTPTTKQRMFEFIPRGSRFHIWSERGRWLVGGSCEELIPDSELGIKRIYPGYKRKLVPAGVDIVEFTNGITWHPDRGFWVRPSTEWLKQPEVN